MTHTHDYGDKFGAMAWLWFWYHGSWLRFDMIDTCFMIYDILYFMYMMIYLYDDFRWYDPASKFHRRQEHRFDGARIGVLGNNHTTGTILTTRSFLSLGCGIIKSYLGRGWPSAVAARVSGQRSQGFSRECPYSLCRAGWQFCCCEAFGQRRRAGPSWTSFQFHVITNCSGNC